MTTLSQDARTHLFHEFLETDRGKLKKILFFVDPPVPMPAIDFQAAATTDGEAQRERLRAEADFAILVNQLPTLSDPGRWATDSRLLWTEYEQILNSAVIATAQSSDQEKAALSAARSVLYTTDSSGRHSDSDKLRQYKECEESYFEARNEHVLLKRSKDSSAAELSQKAAAMSAAMADWRAKGFKAEIEAARATVTQSARTSPGVVWADWRSQLSAAKLTDLSGRTYYRTISYPRKLDPTDRVGPWRQYRWGHQSHELALVTIERPWLDEGLFDSGTWTWPDDHFLIGESIRHQKISQGCPPIPSDGDSSYSDDPSHDSSDDDDDWGRIPAYPVEILVQREGGSLSIIAFACKATPASPAPNRELRWDEHFSKKSRTRFLKKLLKEEYRKREKFKDVANLLVEAYNEYDLGKYLSKAELMKILTDVGKAGTADRKKEKKRARQLQSLIDTLD